MRRWCEDIGGLGIVPREKSFGQRPKFGQVGGNLSLWGPERFFLVAMNAKCTYSLSGRTLNNLMT